MPYTGVCKWFNQIKGNGVIVHEDLNDNSLNGTELVVTDKGYIGNPPKHGDRLFYELEWDQLKERFIAVKVRGGTSEPFDIRKKQTKKTKKASKQHDQHPNRWAPETQYPSYAGPYGAQGAGHHAPHHGHGQHGHHHAPQHGHQHGGKGYAVRPNGAVAAQGPVHTPFAGNMHGQNSQHGQQRPVAWNPVMGNNFLQPISGAPVLYM